MARPRTKKISFEQVDHGYKVLRLAGAHDHAIGDVLDRRTVEDLCRSDDWRVTIRAPVPTKTAKAEKARA
jgi:hypothetical protein